MQRKSKLYLAVTGFFVLGITPSALMNLLQPQVMVDGFTSLGYPLYLGTILGVAKLLGIAAILHPRFNRIKEWAYAGFTFDFLGAAASHAAVGEYAAVAPPLFLLGVMSASYVLWRRGDSAETAAIGGPALGAA